MNREKILNKLVTITVEQLGCDETGVTEEATFESLGADSLDNIELIIAVEKEFGISIFDDEAEQIKTVAQAVDHISSKLA